MEKCTYESRKCLHPQPEPSQLTCLLCMMHEMLQLLRQMRWDRK